MRWTGVLLGILMLGLPSVSARAETDLRLKVSGKNPGKIQGKLYRGTPVARGSNGGRPIWAPTDSKGRFTLPYYALAAPEGFAPIMVTETVARIPAVPVRPSVLDQHLAKIADQPEAQRAESLARIASSFRAGGYPALASVLFERALLWRGPASEVAPRRWNIWWPYLLEYAAVKGVLGEGEQVAELLKQEAEAMKGPGRKVLRGYGEETLKVAALFFSLGSPYQGDAQAGRAMVQVAGILQQKSGLLPRRLSPGWYAPKP